ncbi:hypothetical protein, partial [Cohnella cellulosilytica]
MAKTDWALNDTVLPDDMNGLGAEINANADKLADNLDGRPWEPISLSQGVQVVQGGDAPAILHPTMQGRTLVNLLGRAGKMESLDDWEAGDGTALAIASGGLFGPNMIAVTGQGGFAGVFRTVNLDVTKDYLVVGYVSGGTLGSANITVGIYAGLPDDGVTTNSVPTDSGSPWQLMFGTFRPTSSNLFYIAGNAVGGAGVFEVQANFDGFSIYEITAAEKAYIDGLTTAEAQAYIAANYPYVDDMKHVNAVYIENKGKNLLPPFSEWALHARAVVTDAYKLTLNANDVTQQSYIDIPCVPLQDYSFVGDDFEVYLRGRNKEYISTVGDSFVTTEDTAFIRVSTFDNPSSGTYSFADPMLNIGPEPLPFEPQKPSYLYLPDCNLRSNVDGSVTDRLYTDGQGKPRVMRRFREAVLDGALAWGFQSGASGTGYKTVQTLNFPVGYERSVEPNVIKFDGSKLKYGAPTTDGADYLSATNWSNLGNTVLSIPNSDSGWGESYAPTVDEIKAYFWGWKLYDNTLPLSDTSTYVRTDGLEKRWAYKNKSGTWVTGRQSPGDSLPSDWIGSPYRLMYQLAQSIDEPVTYEGSLMLHEGDNQVEVGTGIVVREAAKASESNKNINIYGHPTVLSTALNWRIDRAITLYKDGDIDYKWASRTDYAYGNYRYTNGDYDPSAAYSVTYLALDAYAIGI